MDPTLLEGAAPGATMHEGQPRLRGGTYSGLHADVTLLIRPATSGEFDSPGMFVAQGGGANTGMQPVSYIYIYIIYIFNMVSGAG